MDADWSVELGADDDTLEFPWSSPDGSLRYVDLRCQPERLTEIPEAMRFPELGEFLRAINLTPSPWLTAKCDVWLDGELGEVEAIHEAKVKLCSYVDLVARKDIVRFSFEQHEQWVKTAARTLSSDDQLLVTCELIVRRCWYHTEAGSLRAGGDAATLGKGDPIPGFYVTFYLFGYGDDEPQARTRWGEGLRRATSLACATFSIACPLQQY